MFLEMLHIRWNDLAGKYDGGSPMAAPTPKPVVGRGGRSV
jgi:hypothetical protein